MIQSSRISSWAWCISTLVTQPKTPWTTYSDLHSSSSYFFAFKFFFITCISCSMSSNVSSPINTLLTRSLQLMAVFQLFPYNASNRLILKYSWYPIFQANSTSGRYSSQFFFWCITYILNMSSNILMTPLICSSVYGWYAVMKASFMPKPTNKWFQNFDSDKTEEWSGMIRMEGIVGAPLME